MKYLFSITSSLQTHHRFKEFQKWTNIQKAGGWSTALNTARTNSCEAWNPSMEYPCREPKHNIKECEGKTFNPILQKEFGGRNNQAGAKFLQNQN